MKIIILSALFLSSVSFASDVPAYLKDGVITVTLTNGQTMTFSENEFKVVPRVNAVETKSHKTIVALHEKVKELSENQRKLNRVRAIGGIAPSGLNTATVANRAIVTNKLEPVYGIGYDRMLSKKWSIGGQALTNETFLINLGLDF